MRYVDYLLPINHKLVCITGGTYYLCCIIGESSLIVLCPVLLVDRRGAVDKQRLMSTKQVLDVVRERLAGLIV
jgi:hypothetical protein